VQGTSHDVKLVTPALLFSKVLIFNWKGAPQTDSILDMLGVLANAAESINLPDDEGKSDYGGEDDDENDDKDECEARTENIFGHLHIIFRDWTFESDETARALLKPEKAKGAKKLSKEAKKRNGIRTTLERVFSSVSMLTFPMPVDNPQTTRVCADTLTEGFKAKVEKLRARVGPQLNEGPTKLGSKTLTCGDLSELMPAVAKVINEDEMITPHGLFAQVSYCCSAAAAPHQSCVRRRSHCSLQCTGPSLHSRRWRSARRRARATITALLCARWSRS
jgi:hypothetical protein